MRTSQVGIDLIKNYEGFSPAIYPCPAGIPTVGYGHVVLKHEKFPPTITKQEAEKILQQDLVQFENSVNNLIKVPLNQNQFDALVSFTFNLGGGALQRSTLRQRLNRGEYRDAANEFTKWVFAGGRRLRGLVRRREAERDLFLS
jgi:lysozyme